MVASQQGSSGISPGGHVQGSVVVAPSPRSDKS